MSVAQPQFDFKALIVEAWEIFSSNAGLILGGTVLLVLGSMAVILPLELLLVVVLENAEHMMDSVPVLGALVMGSAMLLFLLFVLVFGAGVNLILYAGLLALVRRQPLSLGELLGGLDRLVSAVLAMLVIAALGFAGSMLCILPGLFVYFVYSLTFFHIADKGLGFWEAMEASRKTILAAPGPWLLLFLVLLGIAYAGVLACCVGQLVSVPVAMLMLALAYDSVKGASQGQ